MPSHRAPRRATPPVWQRLGVVAPAALAFTIVTAIVVAPHVAVIDVPGWPANPPSGPPTAVSSTTTPSEPPEITAAEPQPSAPETSPAPERPVRQTQASRDTRPPPSSTPAPATTAAAPVEDDLDESSSSPAARDAGAPPEETAPPAVTRSEPTPPRISTPSTTASSPTPPPTTPPARATRPQPAPTTTSSAPTISAGLPDKPTSTSTAYSKWAPHVRTVVADVVARFGVTTVYTRPGHTPTQALAADFMVGTDQARGDAVAQYLIDNADRLGIDNVISRQRIWMASTGWRPMPDRGGITANHFDHVHAAFQEA